MRFPRSTSGKAIVATAVAAVTGVALTFGPGWHRHQAPDDALPQQTPPAVELETDHPKLAVPPPQADGATEDQASRPIQTVVEAEQGDTLLDLLLKAGVDRTEATKAIDALRDVYNPKALKVGQEVTVTFARPRDGIGAGPFDAIVLQPDASRQVSAKRGKDGFSASETKREVTRQLARFTGTIKGSLFEAANQQGVPAPILADMIRAFSYDVDFQRDLQPGDSFEIMFERFVDKKGQVVRDGNILYANLILSGESMPIYRYVDQAGVADYYNPKGESVRKALLRTPVDGARISSGFGMRMHPILGFTKMHKGVDFAVATGTPVMAAGTGVIDYAGANGSYGYYVRIKHDSLHSTAYAHLSRFAQGIRTGKRVDQGQIIAYSGSTGRATGPHLHYEVLVHNEQVNPMSVKFQSGNKLAGKELARFLSTIRDESTLLAQTPVSSRVAFIKDDHSGSRNPD
jgi:murein DD-endopeptidase MepM/ murein hydrolase activator NlpD